MSKKQVIGVFCTEKDLQDPKVVAFAKNVGLIAECDILADGTVEYTDEQLRKLLYGLFGFNKGYYEKELVPTQRTRIHSELVKDTYRYVGTERQDKGWVESAMCSQETREIVKWGTVL